MTSLLKVKTNKAQNKVEADVKRLTKIPGNKICADCADKMPAYADITHNIFICTKCSGIHREMQFKVKGLSVSNFSAEEFEGLESIGNQQFNDVYLAKYEQTPPNSNDLNKFKDFLRQKYIEKRWFVDPNKPAVVNESKAVGSNVSSISPILPAVPALSKTRTSFKKPGNGINNVDLLANDFIDSNPKITSKSTTFDAFSNNSFESFNNKNDLFGNSTNSFGSSTAPTTNNFGNFSNNPSNSFASPVNPAGNNFSHSNFDFPQSNNQFANFHSPATSSSNQNAFNSFNNVNNSTTAATPFDVYQPPVNTSNTNSFDPFGVQPNNPVKAVNTLDLFGDVNSNSTNNDIKPKPIVAEKNFSVFDEIVTNNQPLQPSSNPFDQFASSHQSTHDITRTNNPFNNGANPQLPTTYQQQVYAQNVPRSSYPSNGAPGSYQNYPPQQNHLVHQQLTPQQLPQQLTPQQISQQVPIQQLPPQQLPPPQISQHLPQHLPHQQLPQQLLPQQLTPQQLLPQQTSQQIFPNQYLPQQLPPQNFPQQQPPAYPNQYPPQQLQSSNQQFPHDSSSQTNNNPFYQQTSYQQPTQSAPANVYNYNKPAVPPSPQTPQLVSQSYTNYQNTYPPAQYNNPFNSSPSQQLLPQPPVTNQSAPLVAANDPFSEMINLGLKSLDRPAPPLTKKAVVVPLEPEEMYPREVIRSVPPDVTAWSTATNQNVASNQVFGDANRQTQPINYPAPGGNPFDMF